jgi:hypothetical protein
LVDGSSDWVTEQVQVLADSAQTTLRFTKAYPSNPFIDAVAVVQVPESGPLTYLFIGLSILLAQQFGRHSRY